jgi:hypothetical protein
MRLYLGAALLKGSMPTSPSEALCSDPVRENPGAQRARCSSMRANSAQTIDLVGSSPAVSLPVELEKQEIDSCLTKAFSSVSITSTALSRSRQRSAVSSYRVQSNSVSSIPDGVAHEKAPSE